MINALIDLSLRNRFLVLVFFALLGGWGYWALLTTPIDAIPDLSDNQVIVFTDWPGRSPQEVEDQVTYPLTVSLQGLPGVRVVRSSSAFGFSMINVIFEDAEITSRDIRDEASLVIEHGDVYIDNVDIGLEAGKAFFRKIGLVLLAQPGGDLG